MRWCICLMGVWWYTAGLLHTSTGSSHDRAVVFCCGALSLLFSWTQWLELMATGPVSPGLPCCLKATWAKGGPCSLLGRLGPNWMEVASSRAYSLLVVQTARKGWMVLLNVTHVPGTWFLLPVSLQSWKSGKSIKNWLVLHAGSYRESKWVLLNVFIKYMRQPKRTL